MYQPGLPYLYQLDGFLNMKSKSGGEYSSDLVLICTLLVGVGGQIVMAMSAPGEVSFAWTPFSSLCVFSSERKEYEHQIIFLKN